ncbi:unnamed protein product [Rotaria sp. Silwood1]|nr:unnamed protein product [Rotaria sp. Silwood1]CAF1182986.1 unnamed protein product [Rotaria sp. Silwood1]CAF3457683.1 unnamed protein product [Rotaria sp. Silwood1]CAF3495247.1 unnamed protein product [Rotaria sp. Silwood1]CAF3497004.1 unnamed protein product [Rotaria sp. Silwood1]
MDVKQIHLGNNKSMLNYNSIKRLIHFVHNLEEKLSSVKIIHEKLHELMSIVSKTHDNIVEELTTIKTVLNEATIDQKQDDDEIIPIDVTKSEWDDEEDDDNDNEPIPGSMSMKEFESKSVTNLSTKDQQINSPSSRRTDRLSLYSASSFDSTSTNSSTIENRPSSSTSKRSSNLKKSDQSSTRAKSPKSVSFSIDEKQELNTFNDQNQESNIELFEKPLTEIDNSNIQITTPIISNSNESFKLNSDLIPDLFKQHHNEVTTQPNIGFKMGNALTNVRIHEIESNNGDYLRLLNISNSDDYDLSGHFLQQNIACVPVCRFRFPQGTILRAGQTITVWCGAFKDIEPQFPHIFVWKEKKRWETGPECVTILARPSGQAIAWARSSYRLNSDQSSSKNNSRLSAFYFVGNNKPPFAQSPDSPVHPYHNGGTSNVHNEPRLQINPRSGISHLLNRPKSSPFASHTGCKQDLISMKFLRTQQTTPRHKQTSVNT